MSDTKETDIVEHASSLPFDATVERVVQAIGTHGLTIFSRIDHAANAKEVGLQMSRAIVLIYGSPKGGTPIMVASPLAALDLPLRVLVRERDDGTATIAFHPVATILRRAGVPEDMSVRLDAAQQMLLGVVTP